MNGRIMVYWILFCTSLFNSLSCRENAGNKRTLVIPDNDSYYMRNNH